MESTQITVEGTVNSQSGDVSLTWQSWHNLGLTCHGLRREAREACCAYDQRRRNFRWLLRARVMSNEVDFGAVEKIVRCQFVWCGPWLEESVVGEWTGVCSTLWLRKLRADSDDDCGSISDVCQRTYWRPLESGVDTMLREREREKRERLKLSSITLCIIFIV